MHPSHNRCMHLSMSIGQRCAGIVSPRANREVSAWRGAMPKRYRGPIIPLGEVTVRGNGSVHCDGNDLVLAFMCRQVLSGVLSIALWQELVLHSPLLAQRYTFSVFPGVVPRHCHGLPQPLPQPGPDILIGWLGKALGRCAVPWQHQGSSWQCHRCSD